MSKKSPTDTYGSVRERIARFESLQDGQAKKTSPDKLSVDIVVTPGTPVPELESDHEDVTQEPLSPSIESEVSQAEVKSSSSYNGEDFISEPYLEAEQHKKSTFEEVPEKLLSDETARDVAKAFDEQPRTIIETTIEEEVQLEERSESPQDFGERVRSYQGTEPRDELSPVASQEAIFDAAKIDEKTADEEAPLVEYAPRAEVSSRTPEEIDIPLEDQEYRTLKKTITTVTTTRYVELPDTEATSREEAKLHDVASKFEEHDEIIEDIPAVTKTVTTVTTTHLIEIPEVAHPETPVPQEFQVKLEKIADTTNFDGGKDKTEPEERVKEDSFERLESEKDRPIQDPYSVAAEATIIAASHEKLRSTEDKHPEVEVYPTGADQREEYPPVTETITTTFRYDIPAGEVVRSAGLHEEPLERESSMEEKSLEPTLGDKLASFAGKAAKIAGGAVVAPVALAAMGAAAAYEAVTKKGDQDASYDELSRAKDGKQFVIESEEYETDSQKQPLSSPTTAEEVSFPERRLPEEHHESLETVKEWDATYQSGDVPSAKDEKQFVVESEEYDTESQKQSLSSPTTTEESPFTETKLPEEHHQGLEAVKEWDATYESGVVPPAKDEKQFVIESEEYETDSQKEPLSSLMTAEEVSSTEKILPKEHHESLETVKEWDATYESGDVPSAKDEKQFVIESEEYETESQKQPLSSPTTTEESPFTETKLPEEHHQGLEAVKEWDATYENGDVPSAKDDKQFVIESEEYETEYQKQPLSSPTKAEEASFTERSLPEEYYESFSTDDRMEKEPPSFKTLDVEALENVVRMKFGDSDELESPEKQSTQAPSSYPDEQLSIAGDEEWKVYDNKGVVLEEFSNQLTHELIMEAESNASVQSSHSPSMVIKQDSSNDVSMEPEVDYQSDLQEKLDILAGESREKFVAVQEEDQLEVIDETEYEHEPDEQEIEQTASRLADDAINAALEPHEDAKTLTSTSESNVYQTATEHSKDDQYDTCVTSQDTYDSAQEWTSQESEYTTAASGATSRLSEAEERHGSVTPLAILSPVDSDRQFTANQDFDDVVPIRRFGIDDTARSTPDVALQFTIEEEEEESEATLPTSPNGVLLAPQVDPGRPASPVPPTRRVEEDEEVFVFVEKPADKRSMESSSDGNIEKDIESAEQEAPVGDSRGDITYTRQYSDMSSESHADTVIHHEKGDTETIADAEEIRSS
ncbi:hypothetical protein GCK32_003165 [Trichostrongylus colubriformis]|uniref:Uncharacterized protein n=1 Tax=Trichostrongylus colubriformis TaxID=6319 RepID=A0AAN8IXL9_TRICO